VAPWDGAWPPAFAESRRWCYLRLKPGTELMRAVVETFVRTWQLDAVDPESEKRTEKWVHDLVDGAVSLRNLLNATRARYRDKLHLPEPSAFLIYIDQGEELFVRAEARAPAVFGNFDPRSR
jgi:hypothetical protein